MEGKAADDMEIENLNMGGGTSSAVLLLAVPGCWRGSAWAGARRHAACACMGLQGVLCLPSTRDGVPLLSAHRHAIVATAHTMCAVLAAP